MARYLGTVQGARGEASRLGHQSSGLRTVAASWKGAIETRLYADEHDKDCCSIEARPWHGRGPQRLLYDGPIEALGSVPQAAYLTPMDWQAIRDAVSNGTGLRDEDRVRLLDKLA